MTDSGPENPPPYIECFYCKTHQHLVFDDLHGYAICTHCGWVCDSIMTFRNHVTHDQTTSQYSFHTYLNDDKK